MTRQRTQQWTMIGRRDARVGSVMTPGWFAALLLVVVAAAAFFAPAQAQTQIQTQLQAPRPGAPSFSACESALDEATLRSEVFDGAQAAMRVAMEKVDYERLVEGAWLSVRFDQRFADIVDAKIALLREDRAYLERLLDGNIPSRAQEMAERTADLVFTSPEFERLQQDLQTELGNRLSPMIADAEQATRSEAAACVQTFLGARYAETVRTAFGESGGAGPDLTGAFGSGSVGTSAAINLAGIIAAMLTVVFRRLVRRIVAAVVRRLAGAIAARLAAWASVVVGVVVLVYELIAGSDGVFPVIRDELTSPETKQEIQQALIEELKTVAPEELDSRAEIIAGEMFERWRAFKEGHRAVLELADAEPAFMRFLAEQPPEQFESLSIVTSAVKSAPPGGDAAVMAALDRGVLSRALAIPGIGGQVERWGPRGVGVETLIAWSDAAGPRFERAMALELPGVMAPGDMSQSALRALLDVTDREAAKRIAALEEPARSDVLDLGPERASQIATRFETAPMARFFDALRSVDQPARRQEFLTRVVDRPGLMSAFKARGATSAVSGSDDPERAMDLMLSTSSIFAPFAFYEHVDAVVGGEVSPLTLPYRYGWGLAIGIGAPLLLGLGVLRWILGLFGLRRRR